MKLTRRRLLQSTALATVTLPMPFVRAARGAATIVPSGKMVLAWHTNIAARWLDPQQHDGTATPDNFINALHDALIKNSGTQKFDRLALAEDYQFAEDAKSCTFRLRTGAKFHDGSPITPADVKWSYEHYHGAWTEVLRQKTQDLEIVDDRTIRFHFNSPFLDFPILMGTSNVCGAGWVVPAKYYEKVGQDGFMQKPIGAGPYKLVSQQPGIRLDFEAFDDYYRPVHVKDFAMVAVPEAATRVAMLERGEADIIYFVPGELIARVKNNPKLTLAPVVSGNWWLEFPGFQDPEEPVPRQASARGDQPGDRPRRDEPSRMRRDGGGRRQLDQRRRRIRHAMAEMAARRRQGETADGRGRPSQRLRGRLGDAGAELLFARRAHRLAAAGDRHPREETRSWSAACFSRGWRPG